MTVSDKDPAAVVQSVYDAFARGDIASFFSHLTPDMRWFEAKGHPYGGIYVGADEIVKNVLTPLGTEWANFTAVNDRLVAQGDTVVSIGTYRGTCKATGKQVEAPYATVWKVRDGKVVSLHQHTDTALFWNAMR
jgi:uncharacterized protein